MAPTVRAIQQGDIDALNNVLSTPNLREAHINALVALATAPGNTGIDLDYSRVNAARKADFTSFVTVLSDKLHQAQKTLASPCRCRSRPACNGTPRPTTGKS